MGGQVCHSYHAALAGSSPAAPFFNTSQGGRRDVWNQFKEDKAMLVLSRKTGETIQVGDDVYVTVVRISKHQVRIGVTAPREMKICRRDSDGEQESFPKD